MLSLQIPKFDIRSGYYPGYYYLEAWYKNKPLLLYFDVCQITKTATQR